jgi:hypothetical protein
MFEQPQSPEHQDLNEVAARYGRKVLEPGGKVRFDVDEMNIKGAGVEDVRFGFDILLEFANLPIITDEFRSHEERTSFRRKLSVENRSHYDVLENNKLRGNMISSVESGFSIIGEGIDDTDLLPSVKEKMKALIIACPKYDNESYNAMTLEEKIAYVKGLDELIAKTIALLDGQQEKSEEVSVRRKN